MYLHAKVSLFSNSSALLFLEVLSLGYNEPQLFTYKKIAHSDKSVTDIYANVYLSEYKVHGYCQYDGQLDFLVTIHKPTRELRLLSIKANIFTQKMEPYIYKKVDTDGLVFTDDQVYIDC